MTNSTEETDDNKAASTEAAASPRIQMQLGGSSRKRKRTKAVAETSTNTSPLASSSSSSSSSDEDEPETQKKQGGSPWRVKLYRLNTDGSWDDRGTGRIVCSYSNNNSKEPKSLQQQLGDPTLVLKSEQDENILLRSRVLLREAYQRQGDNIITWCEPYFPEGHEKQPQHPGVSTSLLKLLLYIIMRLGILTFSFYKISGRLGVIVSRQCWLFGHLASNYARSKSSGGMVCQTTKFFFRDRHGPCRGCRSSCLLATSTTTKHVEPCRFGSAKSS